jgi:phosphatidate cytidylyltransferase
MDSTKRQNPRLLYGLMVGGIVAFAAVFGGWLWAALTFAFFPIANRELMALMAAKDIHPSKVTVTLFSLTFYFFALFGLQRHFEIVVTTGIIFTFAWLLLRVKPPSICDIGGTIMMFFYLGFLPAHFILVRQLGAAANPVYWEQPGFRYLFLILFIVSASDVFAYYGGKRFGKKLLSPKISPKKTIEGSITGTFFGVVAGVLVSFWFHLPWIHGVMLGIILSVVAQVGDLSESLIKRDAGLKDSGSFIPGHGGVLDRTDSYIFSGAVGYYYIIWFVLHQGLAREVMEFFQQ